LKNTDNNIADSLSQYGFPEILKSVNFQCFFAWRKLKIKKKVKNIA